MIAFQRRLQKKQHRASLLDTMKKAGEKAEEENVTLVLEPLNVLINHSGYHLSDSRDAFNLIDQIGSDYVKVLFDIYHQQITEGNLLMNITENINKIGHFHAASNPGRNEITKGEINYLNIFKWLERINYNGYIGLEYMTKEDPVKGLIEARENVLI